ncbi:MAG TPA: DUF975 family protein [Candidatus Sulfotelmatobacter sp.]|jgi:uncharacterized membrane protein|nr:DUF975 family protein [Candidatus Sulfotelmatobacter sp.]
MANYYIIGGDGKEYGPITEADIRLWIAEGRLNAQTSTRTDADTNWRPLGAFPEFAALPQTPPTIAPPPSASGNFSAGATSTDYLNRDYEIDLGGCISRGWDLVKGNFSVFFVGALVYFLIEGAIGGLSNIPLVGPVFSIANFVISGPLMAGLYWMFLRGVRNEPAEVGDIFEGFKRSFGQLFLAVLVQSIFLGLCLMPYLVVLGLKFVRSGIHFDPHAIQGDPAAAQEFMKNIMGMLFGTLPVLLVCAIPAMYLATSWKFTLPLILDKRMDFWTAMKTSFKMVNRHWWQIFGLIVLVGLLNVGGVIACCIGLLLTAPIGYAAEMFAYETIFGERKD